MARAGARQNPGLSACRLVVTSDAWNPPGAIDVRAFNAPKAVTSRRFHALLFYMNQRLQLTPKAGGHGVFWSSGGAPFAPTNLSSRRLFPCD
jgi:hypothetical protein